MRDSQDRVAQDVSTESQRQALDEMSRQLVERLNEMVREQNARAERFAATQHSLSPMPERPGINTAAPSTPASEPPPVTPPPAAPEKKKLPFPLPGYAKPREPQDFSARQTQSGDLPEWRNRPHREPDKKKAEEGGCGTIPTIILIVIIVIILRACS